MSLFLKSYIFFLNSVTKIRKLEYLTTNTLSDFSKSMNVTQPAVSLIQRCSIQPFPTVDKTTYQMLKLRDFFLLFLENDINNLIPATRFKKVGTVATKDWKNLNLTPNSWWNISQLKRLTGDLHICAHISTAWPCSKSVWMLN